MMVIYGVTSATMALGVTHSDGDFLGHTHTPMYMDIYESESVS